MSKKKHSKMQPAQHFQVLKRHGLQAIFALMNGLALLMLMALLTYQLPQASIWQNATGVIGQTLAQNLYAGLGYMAYGLPLGISILAIHILYDHHRLFAMHWALLLVRCVGLGLCMAAGAGLFTIAMDFSPGHFSAGGFLGLMLLGWFWKGLQGLGCLIVLLTAMSLGMTWSLGVSWLKVLEYLGQLSFILVGYVYRGLLFLSKSGRKLDIKPWRESPVIKKKKMAIPKLQPEMKELPIMDTAVTKTVEWEAVSQPVVTDGLPDLNLLERGGEARQSAGYSSVELEHLSRQLEQHLLDFAVQAQVVAVHPGPVITRFELQLGAGTKVSKLSSLSKDLARSLSVSRVRVVEIIPGKTVVGLELPNPKRLTVKFGDVLASEVYQHAHSPLSMALGVDIAGYPMIVDLAKMPHLLVAGTTGSGKSVGINAMILSLLFKSSPEQVRLILVDPKMLELSVYDGIPHLLTPVVTDMREAASSLRWCVAEMERRYRLMSGFGVRNIAGFNDKVRQAMADGQPLTDPSIDPLIADNPVYLEPLPYIVVVIDELADMMMVVGKKVEQLIARIAQKARAAGIHLILATQRPSVDVLTGLIKSNIPTRISFQVSSKIDSRTILDQQGAEQLLGHGDMLFLAPGTGAPLRVHGAFVDDNEVHRVAEDWRQRGAPNYVEAITQMSIDFNEAGVEGAEAAEDADPLYDQVVEFVIQSRKASISSVQRRFKIGYNRSARLVEEMERVGILGPLEGGVREVLVPVQE